MISNYRDDSVKKGRNSFANLQIVSFECVQIITFFCETKRLNNFYYYENKTRDTFNQVFNFIVIKFECENQKYLV